MLIVAATLPAALALGVFAMLRGSQIWLLISDHPLSHLQEIDPSSICAVQEATGRPFFGRYAAILLGLVDVLAIGGLLLALLYGESDASVGAALGIA